jgi:hypothetical protein
VQLSLLTQSLEKTLSDEMRMLVRVIR